MTYDLPCVFRARMQKLLGDGFAAFLAAYEQPVRRGLRINTLKCGVEKFHSLFELSLFPSPFCAEGYYVAGALRAGADPLHHAGAYYMQEPSAAAAVTVLDPKPGERILDLCAAPGGKSTQIAAALKGDGLLWANEFVRPRAQALAQNIERCGVRNAVISSADAALIGRGLPGFFDAILVDAPCSGEGMFRKEPDALSGWSEDNIRLCARRQTDILDHAAEALSEGGRLLYSTCTFAPEENEIQIARFLNSHPDFELIDIRSKDVRFGRPGFSWEQVKGFSDTKEPPAYPLEFTLRILPGDGGEGHFIALMQKKGAHVKKVSKGYDYKTSDTASIIFNELYNECFRAPLYGLPQVFGNTVRILPSGLPPLGGLGVISAGVAGAEICKNRLEPCHAVFMAARSADECRAVRDMDVNDAELAAFLRGETIACGGKGWTAVSVGGIVTGFGKASGGILKNRYPKGLRLRSQQGQ